MPLQVLKEGNRSGERKTFAGSCFFWMLRELDDPVINLHLPGLTERHIASFFFPSVALNPVCVPL